MTVCDELQAHLNATGESMRSLSLRSGLNAKAVADILSISGLKPRLKTLVALSETTGRDMVKASSAGVPQTYSHLIEGLENAGKKTLVSRVRWILRKANWQVNDVVCRQDIIDFFARNNAASLAISSTSRSTYKCDILAAVKDYGERNRPLGINDIGGVWFDIYRSAVKADLPNDCIRKAGPFLVYLFDRQILPRDVSTDVLANYFAFRLEAGVVTEQKCRKHVANVVTLLRHLQGNPETAHFGFKAVESPFSDRRNKFGVNSALLAPLLFEFDSQVAPWAMGQASRTGMSYIEFLETLDREEAEPVSTNKGRLRKSVAAKSELSSKAIKTARVERKEAKLREYGFLSKSDRWSRETIATRRGYVISLAKSLAASHDIFVETIGELADWEYLTAAAQALAESNGGEDTGYIGSVLKAMKKIAVGYASASDDDTDEIKALIQFYDTRRRGISPKNKAKLRQFTETRIQSTINLSGTVLNGINDEIDRRRKVHRKANKALPERVKVIDIEMARDIAAVVAHDILLTRAPRSANVIEARLDWIAFQDGKARITVPAVEVKGRQADDPDYVVPLGERSSKLLQNYIEKIRPLLVQEGDNENPFLFPRQAGKDLILNEPYRSILQRVTKLLFAHVGVKINPHLYRHLIGWIWLKESMDNLPRVQILLGHKSLSTTVEYYAELDENLVMDGWQTYLEDKRGLAA